ncbi:MAG: DNA translocase FtsK, partial [Anaerolineae bacterium]|nr:DNA translocase FtsK [Anaerolineae bacterium]
MARKKSVPTGKNEISRPKDMAHPPEEEAQLPLWIESSLDALVRFRRYGRDTGGVMLVVVSSMTLLALIGRTSGAWLTPWASLVRRWLGWGSIFMVIGLGAAGLLLMRRKEEEFTAADWGRVISLELSAVAGIALLAMLGGQSLERAEIGLDGGLVGWGIVELTSRILSFLPDIVAGFLTGGMFLLIFVFGAVYGLGMLGKILQRIESLVDEEPGFQPKAYTGQPAVSVAAMPEFADKAKSDKKNKQHAKIRRISEEHRKEFKIEEEEERETAIFRRDERLPPLDLLLNDKSVKPNERYINETAGMIEQTLAEFGIPAKVVGFQVGPTITQFAVEPGYVQKPGTEGEENRQKVRVSQISGLLKDLALALSAQRLRIQAPVPGRSYVGIEVPNKIISMVGLRAILESEVFHKEKSPLAMAMGRDVSGNPLVADLASMPHLLIAGTTGSGKSVFIEAMTICLVMNNTPDELRLVMVDPKMVELVRFNGLPHLYGKVETELERINGVLRWVVAEMQRRYKLLEELHARDLEGFNRKAKRRKEYEHLPRIVVMIDELADLMMSAGEQTEATIVRLAQMARAVGIHLIVATQRPSTDVVTGLIKAN